MRYQDEQTQLAKGTPRVENDDRPDLDESTKEMSLDNIIGNLVKSDKLGVASQEMIKEDLKA